MKVKNETIQVLDKNIHEFLYNLKVGKSFQASTKNLEAIKKSVDKFDLKFSWQKKTHKQNLKITNCKILM